MCRSGIKRGNDIRVRDGPALGESGISQTLGDSGSQKPVVLHCLIGKSEESEEQECAKNSSPSIDLKRSDESRVLVQQDPRDLEDARVP